jgi:uncharacterized repeat protein (TIGR01451 family)
MVRRSSGSCRHVAPSIAPGRTRLVFSGVLIAVAILVGAGSASATGALDQRNPGPANGSAACDGACSWAQTFTAGVTGSLDTVQLEIKATGAGGDLLVSIEGTDSTGVPNDASVIATQTIPQADVSGAEGNVQTIVFDHPAAVSAGTKYALVVRENSLTSFDYELGTTDDTYAGGQICFSGPGPWNCSAFSGDLVFATYVTAPPPPPPSADVAITISGPSSAARGSQVTYFETISNAGPSTAHNVILKNPVPSGAAFLAASTTRGQCSTPRVGRTGTITCTLGELASTDSATSAVTIKITAKVGSTISDIASAYSTDDNQGTATPDPNTSNNVTTLSTTITK